MKFYQSMIKKLNTNNGQSLVEFITIIPLFFIFLSGIMFIFQHQLRNFIDEKTQFSLNISSSLFDSNERQLAKWDSSHINSQQLIRNMTDKSINASSAFPQSKDMQHGVFYDKIVVSEDKGEVSACNFESKFSVNITKNGHFNFNTCTRKSAYEKADSNYTTNNNDQYLNTFKGESLYFPKNSLAWSLRALEVAHEAKIFAHNNYEFQQSQASLKIPDNAQFNTRCFMEPFKPECSLKAIGSKFSRTAIDSANTQILSCIAEINAICAFSGPAMPACVVNGIKNLTTSTLSGMECNACPATINLIKGMSKIILLHVTTNESITKANEITRRSEIMIK